MKRFNRNSSDIDKRFKKILVHWWSLYKIRNNKDYDKSNKNK